MCYLLNVDYNSMAAHLTRMTVKGFKKCCISSAVNDTDEDRLWNGSEEDENVRSKGEEDKGTDR
jgi:hypothetical protein